MNEQYTKRWKVFFSNVRQTTVPFPSGETKSVQLRETHTKKNVRFARKERTTKFLSVRRMKSKREREIILNFHATNRHMMSKDTQTNPWEDNYLLSPYNSLVCGITIQSYCSASIFIIVVFFSISFDQYIFWTFHTHTFDDLWQEK